MAKPTKCFLKSCLRGGYAVTSLPHPSGPGVVEGSQALSGCRLSLLRILPPRYKRRGKLHCITSPAPLQKKAPKKWSMEETTKMNYVHEQDHECRAIARARGESWHYVIRETVWPCLNSIRPSQLPPTSFNDEQGVCCFANRFRENDEQK